MMAMSKVKSMASFADQLGCGDNDNGTESGANASDDPGDSKKGGDDNTNKNGDTTHHTSNDNDDDDEYRKIAPSSFVPRRGSNYLEIDLDGTETFPSPAESSYCFVYVCKKHAV